MGARDRYEVRLVMPHTRGGRLQHVNEIIMYVAIGYKYFLFYL